MVSWSGSDLGQIRTTARATRIPSATSTNRVPAVNHTAALSGDVATTVSAMAPKRKALE